MANRALVLADGENLVTRYQSMLASGATSAERTKHIKDVFVWHPDFTKCVPMEVIRVSFYTTQVGDDPKLEETRQMIASNRYECYNIYRNVYGNQGNICPHVFKKEKTSQKTKSVDINIAIDALRHTYNNSMDILFLLSGDGDYIPLIQEVMRQGKRVFVGAFSDGLNSDLKFIPDLFFNLDVWTIKKKQ
jgi:uncharacterized protein (TIGR00288 family)